MIETPSTVDNFYITRDILNTPSHRKGVSELCEFHQRAYGASLIAAACELLEVKIDVTPTAQTLLHRFYTKKSLTEYDVRVVATAAITLACKLEEHVRKTRDVLNCMRRAQERAEGTKQSLVPLNSPEYEESKSEAHFMEMVMLREFGFFAHCSAPQKYAVELCIQLEFDDAFTKKVWILCNDSFLTPLCVRFKPEVIACGCIYLAACQAGISMPQDPPWWRLVDGACLVNMATIATTLLALYAVDKKFEYLDLVHGADKSNEPRRSRSPTQAEFRVRRRDSRDFDQSRDRKYSRT